MMRLAFSIALVGISLGADFANGQPVQETNPTSLLPLPPIPCVPPLPGTSEPDVCKVFNPAAVCGSYVCQLPVPTVSVPYDAADDPRHEGGNKYFDFRSSTVFIPCYENRTYSAPYVDMASYAWCPTVDEVDARSVGCPPNYVCSRLVSEKYRHPPDYVVPPSVCVKRIPEHGLCLSTADDHWILPNGMVADIEYFPSLLYNNPCENPSQVACDTTTQKCAPLNRRTEGPSKKCRSRKHRVGSEHAEFLCPCDFQCLNNGTCIAGMLDPRAQCDTDGDCPNDSDSVCLETKRCGLTNELAFSPRRGLNNPMFLVVIAGFCFVSFVGLVLCLCGCRCAYRAVRKRGQRHQGVELKT